MYGTTNMGKTTQMDLLKFRCERKKMTLHTQKYPIYDLEPTGPLIFEAIKKGNPKKISAAEIQALMAKNRFDFQQRLIQLCKENDLVAAEMYTGTGIAYGVGDGVNMDVLLAINDGLVHPGVNILFEGERFMESVEKGHRFEEDEEKTSLIRGIHYKLALTHGWSGINANQSPEKVHEAIWEIIQSKVFK